MRIPTGWPPRQPATTDEDSEEEDNSDDDEEFDDETANQLDSLMSDGEFREKLYQYTLEMWDLDIETFRIWLLATDGDDMWDIHPEDFEDVVIRSVKEGSSYFT